MKLKILGLGNIEYEGDPIDENTDYLLLLRVSKEGDYVPIQGQEGRTDLKLVHIESLINTKSKIPLKVKKGKSWSQTMRWTIFSYLNSIGELEVEENYEKSIKFFIRAIENSHGKRALWDKIETTV